MPLDPSARVDVHNPKVAARSGAIARTSATVGATCLGECAERSVEALGRHGVCTSARRRNAAATWPVDAGWLQSHRAFVKTRAASRGHVSLGNTKSRW